MRLVVQICLQQLRQAVHEPGAAPYLAEVTYQGPPFSLEASLLITINAICSKGPVERSFTNWASPDAGAFLSSRLGPDLTFRRWPLFLRRQVLGVLSERLPRSEVRELLVPLLAQVARRGAPACQAAALQPAVVCGLARKLGLPAFLSDVVPLLLQLLLSPQHHSDAASASVLQVELPAVMPICLR